MRAAGRVRALTGASAEGSGGVSKLATATEEESPAHLDRKRICEEGQEPAERDGGQLDTEVLEVVRDVGHDALDEVAQDALISLRDEKVRGVVVRGKDFLVGA